MPEIPPLVCCLPEDINKLSDEETITSDVPGKVPTGVYGKEHVSRGCGIRNSNGIAFRIVGNSNNEANFAEYPWMVAILKDNENRKEYKCGGSLIHPKVVLTAAHCVQG